MFVFLLNIEIAFLFTSFGSIFWYVSFLVVHAQKLCFCWRVCFFLCFLMLAFLCFCSLHFAFCTSKRSIRKIALTNWPMWMLWRHQKCSFSEVMTSTFIVQPQSGWTYIHTFVWQISYTLGIVWVWVGIWKKTTKMTLFERKWVTKTALASRPTPSSRGASLALFHFLFIASLEVIGA